MTKKRNRMKAASCVVCGCEVASPRKTSCSTACDEVRARQRHLKWRANKAPDAPARGTITCVEVREEDGVKVRTRKCDLCPKVFEITRFENGKRLCGATCKAVSQRGANLRFYARQKEEIKGTRECLVCGVIFVMRRTEGRQKICSDTCRQERSRERIKKYKHSEAGRAYARAEYRRRLPKIAIWYQANRERLAERNKEYREANKEAVLHRARERYRNKIAPLAMLTREMLGPFNPPRDLTISRKERERIRQAREMAAMKVVRELLEQETHNVAD